MAYFNNGYNNGFYGNNGYGPQQQNGIIWVQGLEGAKSYMVTPGSTVLLMDSESRRFYIKSVDVSGMPAPIKAYEFQELAEQTQAQPHGDYVTREEFNRLEAKIEALKQPRKDGGKKHE